MAPKLKPQKPITASELAIDIQNFIIEKLKSETIIYSSLFGSYYITNRKYDIIVRVSGHKSKEKRIKYYDIGFRIDGIVDAKRDFEISEWERTLKRVCITLRKTENENKLISKKGLRTLVATMHIDKYFYR